MAKKQRANGQKEQNTMAHICDELTAYEKFRSEVAPKLRALVEKGASAEEIYAFSESMIAAKAVTIALQEADSARAMTAIKEILDRSKGKAKERHENVHKFEKLKDQELDALIESRLAEAEMDEEHSEH